MDRVLTTDPITGRTTALKITATTFEEQRIIKGLCDAMEKGNTVALYKKGKVDPYMLFTFAKQVKEGD